MLYITGIHALNLPCYSLNTSGDWHQSAIQWVNPQMRESDNMFFKDYGIEPDHSIPEHSGVFYVANTIRACLDLLEESKFTVAQGMNEDFICNESYDSEVFRQVDKMRFLPNWNEINQFMKKEYRTKWIIHCNSYIEEDLTNVG